ncbi:MAG: hypothetical protein EB060_03925 [Proteobacteria bacterium]|nr:hypothetical protein [Pseudomonadota bacterium]
MTHDLDSYLMFCALAKLEHSVKANHTTEEEYVECACAKYMNDTSESISVSLYNHNPLEK